MTITNDQRRAIRMLSGGCCEYCRIAEGDHLVRFQIDNIIPVKHGGADVIENLCLACLECNSYKGANVAALAPLTGDATKLFNPRRLNWNDHFQIRFDGSLVGTTPEGRATITVLRINLNRRAVQRLVEMNMGTYPCEGA